MSTPAPVFEGGTKFEGFSMNGNDMLWMTFSVSQAPGGATPTAPEITPLEIAEALSAIAEAKGFQSITFMGHPARTALNP